MSGRGPAVDSTGFTFMTGNGDVGNSNISQSFVHYGTNHKQSGGPLLIPGTSLVLGGGKIGLIYMLNITSAAAFADVYMGFERHAESVQLHRRVAEHVSGAHVFRSTGGVRAEVRRSGETCRKCEIPHSRCVVVRVRRSSAVLGGGGFGTRNLLN